MRSALKTLMPRTNKIRVPIATKLVLSFLIIVVFISAIYMIVGVQLISNRIVSEAQDKVRHDLNAARELYLSNLDQINSAVRMNANRFFLRDALLTGELIEAYIELQRVRQNEGLDVLTLTDETGQVIIRGNLFYPGDDVQADAVPDQRALVGTAGSAKHETVLTVEARRR